VSWNSSRRRQSTRRADYSDQPQHQKCRMSSKWPTASTCIDWAERLCVIDPKPTHGGRCRLYDRSESSLPRPPNPMQSANCEILAGCTPLRQRPSGHLIALSGPPPWANPTSPKRCRSANRRRNTRALFADGRFSSRTSLLGRARGSARQSAPDTFDLPGFTASPRPFQEAMTAWCWGFGWGDDVIDASALDDEPA
jgi:hypothetical protein